MKRQAILFFAALTAALALSLGLSAAETVWIGENPVPLAGESAVRTPVIGTLQVSGKGATIDYSHSDQGYVMCRYTGSASRLKVQITRSGGTTYTYNLDAAGGWEVYPLTAGDGAYTIAVYQHAYGNSYTPVVNTSVQVILESALLPFLYPSQYVNFSAASATVAKGGELAGSAANDLEVVGNVYNFVIGNISYDTAKAAQVSAGQLTGYLPEVDGILSSGKGICFDYAAVMTAMLRSQGIPTRLSVGYAGGVYHAWVNVYITDVGWVNGVIYFDGVSWKLMDPTFAASGGQSAEIMGFIGNGANYNTVYVY